MNKKAGGIPDWVLILLIILGIVTASILAITKIFKIAG